MNALLAFELLKLRTLRAPCALVLGGVVLSGVVGTVGALAEQGAVTARQALLAPAQLLWLAVVVVAVVATAAEFQHRTVRTTLLAVPRRQHVLAAKALASAAVGAAVTAVGCATSLLAAVVARSATGETLPSWSADAATGLAGAVGVGAVWGVVAAGLGVLTRNVAVALVAVLLWRFVGEGLLPIVTRSPEIVRWMPSGVADALLGLGGGRLSPATAALVLAGYAGAVVGVAALAFLRRDPA